MNEESDRNQPQAPGTKRDIAREANKPATGLVAEFLGFMRTHKKWWLTPLAVMLLLLIILAVLSGSGVTPFIYPLS